MRPCGRQDDDARRVGELLLLGVPDVAEADGRRERRDRGLVARQEVPALRRRSCGRTARMTCRFFADAISGVSRGSKLTDRTSNSVPALEAQGAQAPHEAVGRHAAEHRAVEVDEGQDDGLLPEVLARAGRSCPPRRGRRGRAEPPRRASGRSRRPSSGAAAAEPPAAASPALPRREARGAAERARGASASASATRDARFTARPPARRGRRHGRRRGQARRGDDLERAVDRHARDALLPVDPGPRREVGVLARRGRPRRSAAGFGCRFGPGGTRASRASASAGGAGSCRASELLEKDRDAPHEAHDDERDGREADDEAENAAEVQLAVDRPAAGFGGAASRAAQPWACTSSATARFGSFAGRSGSRSRARARTPRARGRRARRAS